jgi:hypothetical protein
LASLKAILLASVVDVFRVGEFITRIGLSLRAASVVGRGPGGGGYSVKGGTDTEREGETRFLLSLSDVPVGDLYRFRVDALEGGRYGEGVT